MIKLMHFIHGLSMGGAETLVKDYCLNTDRTRFDLVLLCLTRNSVPYEQMLEDAGIRVIYISDQMSRVSVCRITLLRKLGEKIMLFYYVRKIIREERPDVLHTHLPIDYYAAAARPAKGTAIFHTVHSDPKKLWTNALWRKMDFKALVWLRKKYGLKFIVLHEEMRREVNRLFGIDDAVVVNNGVDFSRFEHLPSKAEIRRSIGIPEDAFLLGHVGRFSYMKNHKFLLDVFALVKKKRPDARLLLVGAGELKDECEQKIQELGLTEDVLILSNRTDIPQLLTAMDLFVFPSTYEGLPVSMVEAQRAGLRCMMSDAVTDQVIISNLVKPLSLGSGAEAWADEILHAPETVPEYYAPERWDVKSTVNELEALYLSEISEKSSGM